MLEKIISCKKQEVAGLKKKFFHKMPPAAAKEPFLFYRTLKQRKFSIIAEIKRKSPTAGKIRSDLEPGKLARIYERAGAAAISVLTDKKFFGAKDGDLKTVKKSVRVPVLKKDFIIDEVQLYQAAASGADAVLLITTILSPQKIKKFLSLAKRLGLDCLVEVHNLSELHKALKSGAKIIGVNNRNLKTGQVELETSFRLLPLIPASKIAVSESGVKSSSQAQILKQLGARAILVGESILKSRRTAEKIKELKKG
jgi:indole-3-glycerol phosphate synthase